MNFSKESQDVQPGARSSEQRPAALRKAAIIQATITIQAHLRGMLARRKVASLRKQGANRKTQTLSHNQHGAARKTFRNKTVKCGDCLACRRKTDCLVCSHCTDKTINGGPNKLKQACKEKACKMRKPLPQGTSDYQGIKCYFFF